MNLKSLQLTLSKLSLNALGVEFDIHAHYDKKYGKRIYLQVGYAAPCTKTNEPCHWRGRKWYLSSHMTEDEVVKTAFAAFKATVEHEVMEGFKYDGTVVFNPHVNFQELIAVSTREIKRKDHATTK